MSQSKYTLVLDSSQLQAFSECPQYWQYAYRERIVPAHAAEKEAMNAGTYGHAILDRYYKKRAAGGSIDDSYAEAISYDPDQQICECGHSLEDRIKDTTTQIYSHDGIGSHCPTCVCDSIRPKQFSLGQELRFAVRGRIREHVYKYRDNDFKPYNAESVEVGFSEPIYEDSENLFVLEGRLDLLGTLQGLPCIADHKFQMRRRDLYHKSIQFRNYALVGKCDMLAINYIRLSKKLDDTTLVRELSCFTAAEREWWHGQLVQMFFKIKAELQLADAVKIFRDGTTLLRQEWGACSGKFGYPCAYTDLCETLNPELVQLKKNAHYVQKEEWKPW